MKKKEKDLNLNYRLNLNYVDVVLKSLPSLFTTASSARHQIEKHFFKSHSKAVPFGRFRFRFRFTLRVHFTVQRLKFMHANGHR